MNKRLEELRDEGADKRSKRQCTTGQPDLDKAISFYLKVGYVDGFRDAIAELMPRVQKLVEALDKVQCSCTVGERMSGHNTDCFMPYTNHALTEWREFTGEGKP